MIQTGNFWIHLAYVHGTLSWNITSTVSSKFQYGFMFLA